MKFEDIYEPEFFEAAFEKRQKGLTGSNKDDGPFITFVDAPEILDDKLVKNFLFLNYLHFLDFKTDGSPVMGEVGGVIPSNPENGKQVLAISDTSTGRVFHAFEKIREYERTGMKEVISELEKTIETKLKKLGNSTIVDGNINAAHYDFITAAAAKSPKDLLRTNSYLLLAHQGFRVLTEKFLYGEQYIFNFPENTELFESLRLHDYEKFQAKKTVLKQKENIIVPDDFIAGFHIIYSNKKTVTLKPVLGENTAKKYADFLRKRKLEPAMSKILYIGFSDTGDSENTILGLSDSYFDS
jgi:hypothetical protein